jgi:hypothetical protein
MKKVTTVFGILSAFLIIAGVIHKIFHLPGAFYLLIFGLGVFLLVYLVLLCIQKIREARGPERIMHIVKYVSYLYFAYGFLFFIDHLSGALYLMDLGFLVFIVGYLPLKFMVQRTKHPEGGALNKVIPPLIVVALIFALASRNMGDKIFESIANTDIQVKTMSIAADTSLNHVMAEFELNKSQFPSQIVPNYEKAVKIKKISDEVVDYMIKCKQEVIKLCCKEENADTLRLDELSGRNRTAESNHYFMGVEKDGSDGKANEIRRKVAVYSDSVKMIMGTDTLDKIKLSIEFTGYKLKDTGKEITWEVAMFHDNMLINDLAYLDLLILSVRQTEKDLIASLLSDARAETMWTFWRKYKELVPDKHTK